MSGTIGRIEILPVPLAEWMTQALEAHGPFRVSLPGGSTPKVLYGLLGVAVRDEEKRRQRAE
jgi:6-phosphogluconolactonase/glucosamine-6-phosphate isomerase/deaminase